MDEDLDEEYLLAAERRARVFQGAWTGTSGTLAADVIRLIYYCRKLRRDHEGRGAARNGKSHDHRTPDYLRPSE